MQKEFNIFDFAVISFVMCIPGVNTADILTAYISGIRALRVLDPTGVLLELVCEPVRTYLRYVPELN